MTQLSCFDCRFFSAYDEGIRSADLNPEDRNDFLHGHCRRNPPAVGRFRREDVYLEYDYGQWPIVTGYDWCGALEPNPATPPESTAQPCLEQEPGDSCRERGS